MTRSSSASLLVALLAAVLVSSCSDDDRRRPDVVLVIADTLRADRLRAQGGPDGLTPYMDRLAEGGVRFAQARSHAPWTLPSTASLLTSLHPLEHGAGGNVETFTRLRDGVPTLAQSFRDAGYDTHAVVNVTFLDPETFGVTRDFDSVDNVSFQSNVDVRDARATTAAALEWLDARETQDRPAFLLVHYFDPHCVYAPPPSFREQWAAPEDRESTWTFGTRAQMIAIRDGTYAPDAATLVRAEHLYEGEVAYLDAEVGRLAAGLEERGLFGEGSVFALTGDHGEEFGDHGGFEHGHTLYDELLHVPLFVRAPGALEPDVVEAPVRLIDVAPTLLELCDLPRVPTFVGRSLVPLARGEDDAPRPTFAHGNMWGAPQSAWISGSWKLVEREGAPPMLFDLARDPEELRDVAAEETERLAELQDEANAVARAMRALASGDAAELDEATRDRLRGFGYGKSKGPR
ncbi:MAG: sulfatase, partial [Planctomycetota bacterium]